MRRPKVSAAYFIWLLFASVWVLFISTNSVAASLDNWHMRNEPDNTMTGITYGNGTFVAVGLTGTILTSSDGATWTARTSGTSIDLNGITYGNGIFVAVGARGGTVLTSPDGNTWTRTTPIPGIIASIAGDYSSLNGITYANGTFVAVGSWGTIVTSPDGAVWTARTSGITKGFYGIAYGNSTFVAVGESGTIFTSPDGAVWTKQNSGITVYLNGITYGNNTFVAVGYGGDIFTSSNGASWTPRTSGTVANLGGITYGNGTFVAVGDLVILTSSDGNAWITRNTGPNGVSGAFAGITYGNNGTFVAVGRLSGTAKGIIAQSDSVSGNTGGSSCTATLDQALNLNIPIIKYTDPAAENIYLWTDMTYVADPSKILFKLSGYGLIPNAASYICIMSTLSSDLTIHVMDLALGGYSYWIDLKYDASLSSGSNLYFYVSAYGSGSVGPY